MARERMITRTVITTVYNVLAVELEKKSVETIEVRIASAESISKKHIDKAIKNAMPTGYAFVQIISEAKEETLYGMLEDDFIKYAKVLPPRGTKEE